MKEQKAYLWIKDSDEADLVDKSTRELGDFTDLDAVVSPVETASKLRQRLRQRIGTLSPTLSENDRTETPIAIGRQTTDSDERTETPIAFRSHHRQAPIGVFLIGGVSTFTAQIVVYFAVFCAKNKTDHFKNTQNMESYTYFKRAWDLSR